MAPNKRDQPKNPSPHMVERSVQTILPVEGVVCQIYPYMFTPISQSCLIHHHRAKPLFLSLVPAATSACNLRAGKTVEISHFGAWSLWDKVQKKKNIYNILSETSCEIFTPFFYRSTSGVFVMPHIATFAAGWRIYL